MSDDGISLREFGRLVEKTGEAVRRAILTGKIPAAAVGETRLSSGRTRPTIIDPDLAATAWKKNVDPLYVRDREKISQGRKAAYARARGEQVPDDAPPPAPAPKRRPPKTHPPGGGGGDDDGGMTITLDELDNLATPGSGGRLPTVTESRAMTEAYKAGMAQLDYLEKRGQLVDAEEFRLRFAGMIKSAQSKIMAVPGKAKSRIPTLTVADIEMLEDLLSEAMEELADGR